MPIHLQSLPRRTFLHRTVAGAGGLLLATRLVAATREADGDTWAMLSDLHIAADPEQLGRGINMADHLRQVCQEIVALQRGPAGVIVHGDCAFSIGRRGDYTHLLQLLHPLRASGLPIHLALGNHDHLLRFLAAVKPTDPSAVANKYVSRVESQQANFFILDS